MPRQSARTSRVVCVGAGVALALAILSAPGLSPQDGGGGWCYGET